MIYCQWGEYLKEIAKMFMPPVFDISQLTCAAGMIGRRYIDVVTSGVVRFIILLHLLKLHNIQQSL